MKPALNLRQVEAFYSVMRTGTVVEAARLMNVTQPAVSRALSLLEHRIGYPLFERRGRRLVPRPEGEMLYREIEPIYGRLDRIAQVAQDIRYQRAGALRIATLPAMSQGLVPRAIARFSATRPQVAIFVQSVPSRQVAELVSSRQFDVGVVELPLSHPAVAVEALDPVPAMAVLPVTHALAKKRQLSLKDLAQERMILLSRHSLMRHQIDDAFARLKIAANVVIETPNSQVACTLVAAGAGITLVSRWSAASFLSPQVVARPIKEELTSRAAVIFPEPGSRLMLAEAFAKELRQEILGLKRA